MRQVTSSSPVPRISVVIATYNSGRTLKRCLTSLANQSYPQNKLELIIADGGSTDATLKIAHQFGARIINVPRDRQGAEYNKGYGLQFAQGEFLLCIDHDNILPHSNWLRKMLLPLLENDQVVAVEPWRYRYEKNLSLLDRYFALFGVNDPLPYYLGKADRMDYIHDTYNLIGQARQKNGYYLVKFDPKNPQHIPTLGANGFLIRKSFFLKSAHQPENYYHIDINVDLVKKGHNLYAFIKDDIIHLTNSRFFNFINRRRFFMQKYYFKDSSNRRYSVFDFKQDRSKLIIYVIYSLTFIKPTLDSLRGWLKIKDMAWFIHPWMCFFMTIIYMQTFVEGILIKKFNSNQHV